MSPFRIKAPAPTTEQRLASIDATLQDIRDILLIAHGAKPPPRRTFVPLTQTVSRGR